MATIKWKKLKTQIQTFDLLFFHGPEIISRIINFAIGLQLGKNASTYSHVGMVILGKDFPKNHNVILIGQPVLISNLSLTVNQDIKSRITYSTIMRRINPDTMHKFILSQLDRVKLGHNTFTEDAIDLIVRSSDGVLRKARNLCLSCMLEAVRLRNKTIGLENVNKVLIQPHWRKDCDLGQF